MRVLIVEDNSFNAFCLRRLLESFIAVDEVTIVNNSHAALSSLYEILPDLVIVGANLGSVDAKSHCSGFELSHIILHKYPHLPLIVWLDAQDKYDAFAQLFNRYNRTVNNLTLWPKTISLAHITKAWSYHVDPVPAEHFLPTVAAKRYHSQSIF